MKRTQALAISLIFTIVIFVAWYQTNKTEKQRVVVSSVIDGDTLKLEDGRTIRLININTPEKKERYYIEAKEHLAPLENKSVDLEVIGIEKYGRTLGRIYAPDYVNLEIVESGFAHSFLVQDRELKEFKRAQANAFENERGVWQRSDGYGCLKGEINKKEEYIDLEEVCGLNTKGWTIGDESTKKYVLDKNVRTVRLYSEKGSDNEKELFWGEGNVWNDDRDSLFIRDSSGLLVYYNQYGY